jgi:hypothetical protein
MNSKDPLNSYLQETSDRFGIRVDLKRLGVSVGFVYFEFTWPTI